MTNLFEEFVNGLELDDAVDESLFWLDARPLTEDEVDQLNDEWQKMFERWPEWEHPNCRSIFLPPMESDRDAGDITEEILADWRREEEHHRRKLDAVWAVVDAVANGLMTVREGAARLQEIMVGDEGDDERG